MNALEAMEIISAYISMLYNQGVLSNCEIIELENAEKVVYNYLNSLKEEEE